MTNKAALLKIVGDNPQLQRYGPGPSRVLVMSGPPLSGKSHMVGLIEKKVPGTFLLVRSDEVRVVVAQSLGRQRPAYDDIEHAATFIVASEVVRAGLSLHWPVIADATNLREDLRRWAYVPADALKASILVVFMQVTDEIAIARLSERDRDGSAATFNVYQKLKYEMEPIDRCTRQFVVINSEGDMRPHAKELANWLTGKADFVPGLRHNDIRVDRPKSKAHNGQLDFYTGQLVE